MNLTDHQQVSAGLQGGFAQKSIAVVNPKTNSQWINNSYNPNQPSGELGNYEPYGFGDFSFGLSWSYWKEEMNMASNDQVMANIGIAFFHVNQPAQQFSLDEIDKLYSKLVVHGSAYLGVKGTPTALIPSFVFYRQGPTTEMVLGGLFRYRIKEDSRYTGFVKETTVYLGAHYRVKDAVIPTLMLTIMDYSIAFSYDFNLSGLKSASKGRGGFEISLSYISPKSLIKGKSKGAKTGAMM